MAGWTRKLAAGALGVVVAACSGGQATHHPQQTGAAGQAGGANEGGNKPQGGNGSPTGGQGGTAQGGTAQGGTTQGGTAQGGFAQGGTAGSGGTAQGGAAGSGGLPSSCQAMGQCAAASCASKQCFDLDHCADSNAKFWSTTWHDEGEGLVLTAADERIIVGQTQLGNPFDSDRDFFVTKLSVAGDELWSFKLGTPAKEFGLGITQDAAGNLYATGSSEGNIDGHTNLGGRDVFVIKLSPQGKRVWSLLFGTANTDQGEDIALDPQGNVLVVGSWNYTEGTEQPFLARISPAGVLLEAKPLAVAQGTAASIDIDADGNAYVTGEAMSADGKTNDAFAKKIAPNDDELWSLEWGSTAGDWSEAATLDGAGRLYVAGTTSGAIGNNPAPKQGNWSAFLTLIDTAGKELWTRSYYPDIDTRGAGVAMAKNGDVLMTGNALGKFTLDDVILGVDPFVMRLCPDGTPKTAQRRDLGSDDWTRGFEEAHDGSIVLAGYSYQTTLMNAAQNSEDAYVLTFQPK